MQSIFDALGLDESELEWPDLAVCKGQDTNDFYDFYEQDADHARVIDEECLSCPVRKQCLQAGVDRGEWGVWGAIYLVSGRPDQAKNAHKTQDVWERIREGISE
jgi:hypothetical protein